MGINTRLSTVYQLSAGLLLFSAAGLSAQDFENEPIRYSTAAADNPISRLQTRLDQGTIRLQFDEQGGYLRSLLSALDIPISSQTLVYSKTSLQRQKISPSTPRALYFNDDVYIGYCQNGALLEVSAADPQLGAAFYSLDQESTDHPKFFRQVDNCLSCHGSSQTRHVPGFMIRSVYVDSTGIPQLAMGTHRIDHSSPIENRWGGWYVTGSHGSQTHLGNLIVKGKAERETVLNPAGQNVLDLNSRFQTSAYLTPHSDLIALMVLEHQAEAHNLITRASFQSREALYAETRLNKELGEPENHRWQSTTTRIRSSAEELLKYMLFCGEAPLREPIRGTSSFSDDFSHRGPRDSQGRSLRDFDLRRRLFKYPCSYLIYSETFERLPTESKDLVLKRLYEVLSGSDRSKTFAHLTDADRLAILEILRETLPHLPDYWRAKPVESLTR